MKQVFSFLNEDVSGFLISTKDEFLNEYSHENANRLEVLTNFSGSNGIAILKKEGKSAFFTDGRYKLQASKELDLTEFDIFDVSELPQFLVLNFKTTKIALDPKLNSFSFVSKLKNAGVLMDFCEKNPIDLLFSEKNFKMKDPSFWNFALAGESSQEKFLKVFAILEEEKADAMFIFNPHETCWLFNIRGNFLKNTPVANYFGIVSHETQKFISFDQIEEVSYNTILVSKNISYYCYLKLNSFCKNIVFSKFEYIQDMQVIKTDSEIECIRNAYAQDAKALCNFLKWAKETKCDGETELTLQQKLCEFRQNQAGFVCESFPSIIGFKENGAIIHYNPSTESAKQIKGSGILLIDSGGQYYDESQKICGTTDITRVISLGNPTPKQKRIYTLVLKGHIAIATSVFPNGTTGAQLDILARQFLFSNGLNYEHGTGHGVGYFLSVHEGSCGISKNCNTVLRKGMIISNEPGCYIENEFGIRVENLLLVKDAEDFDGFLKFEVLTKVPIEAELLDYDTLTDSEVRWLEEYHGTV